MKKNVSANVLTKHLQLTWETVRFIVSASGWVKRQWNGAALRGAETPDIKGRGQGHEAEQVWRSQTWALNLRHHVSWWWDGAFESHCALCSVIYLHQILWKPFIFLKVNIEKVVRHSEPKFKSRCLLALKVNVLLPNKWDAWLLLCNTTGTLNLLYCVHGQAVDLHEVPRPPDALPLQRCPGSPRRQAAKLTWGLGVWWGRLPSARLQLFFSLSLSLAPTSVKL